MAINGVGGPRQSYTPNRTENANFNYPGLKAESGKGAAVAHGGRHHAKHAGHAGQAGQAGGAQGANGPMQKLVQVLGQILQLLNKLLGGQNQGGAQGAQGGSAAGSPGAAGGPDAGGNTGIVGPKPPTQMPDLTGAGNAGGVTGVNGAGAQNGVPFISQYSPAGSERGGYTNGAANCAPTSMAMIARSMGLGQGLTDAQLITKLGQAGGTDANGTSINGVVAMAHELGVNAEIHGPKADTNWIDQQLAAGKKVVANGDYYAEPGHNGGGRQSGHYLDVVGKDQNGNYLIQDPADQNVKTMTPQQLATFINSNPVNGGYCVAVG